MFISSTEILQSKTSIMPQLLETMNQISEIFSKYSEDKYTLSKAKVHEVSSVKRFWETKWHNTNNARAGQPNIRQSLSKPSAHILQATLVQRAVHTTHHGWRGTIGRDPHGWTSYQQGLPRSSKRRKYYFQSGSCETAS